MLLRTMHIHERALAYSISQMDQPLILARDHILPASRTYMP